MLPTTRTTSSEDLAAQRAYARKMAGTRPNLVVADAFVRSIRSLGYKSTATALFEDIDNSIEAGAENIHVIFGYNGKSEAKPDQIFVIDDGHGMPAEMLPYAISWGGTHREAPDPKNRHGMGRFGFGLPSSSVSQGRRFTVFSKTEDGDWNEVTLDLDEIVSSQGASPLEQVLTPEPKPAKLPARVSEYIKNKFDSPAKGKQGLNHGTVIMLDKLDNLNWSTTAGLQTNLPQQFGVVYRNFLQKVNIAVNGIRVEPLDPLFVTPGYRFYDLDDDRAIPMEPIEFEVKGKESRDALGKIYVRMARLPYTFPRERKDAPRLGKANARSAIMADNNGYIFVREGRQIDVVTKNPWFGIQNNDRFWKVEINFPASLDEEFSVTTNKQQIVPSEKIWSLLDQAGVQRAVQQMKKDWEEDKGKHETKSEKEGEKRPSEIIMEEAGPSKPHTPEREQQATKRLEREAEKQSHDTGKPLEKAKEDLEAQFLRNPYKVYQEHQPGGPFFRIEQLGGQVALFLNTAHRFFTEIYAGPESTPRLHAALELLLFVIGECKLDSTPERQDIYDEEIYRWSVLLPMKLGALRRDFKTEDLLADKASKQEMLEQLAHPRVAE